ncbi:MAG: hypothetical protein HZA77_13040 [Candidatus Schekmanbacteria bacterium]|nr:hypothetical protein [Candidatus Schekmanbacteria bacterium]
MKKSTYLLIAGAILMIIILNLLPSKEIPSLPKDETHKEYIIDDKCLECHGPGKIHPLPNKHPHEPENCKRCHIDKIYR